MENRDEKKTCLNCVNQLACLNNQRTPAKKDGKIGFYLPIGKYNSKLQRCDKYEYENLPDEL